MVCEVVRVKGVCNAVKCVTKYYCMLLPQSGMCICGHIKDLLVLFSLGVHICDGWLVFSAGEDAEAPRSLGPCDAYLEGEEVAVSSVDLKAVTVVPRDINDKNLITEEIADDLQSSSYMYMTFIFNTCTTVSMHSN